MPCTEIKMVAFAIATNQQLRLNILNLEAVHHLSRYEILCVHASENNNYTICGEILTKLSELTEDEGIKKDQLVTGTSTTDMH